MIDAVLFDLDGTLLDIDVDSFLRDYFGALGPVVARVIGDGHGPKEALAAVIAGTDAMQLEHPGRTNQHVFEARFLAETGVDLGSRVAAEAIEDFYRDVFPSLQGVRGPRDGARDAVETARRLGLRVAIATNPIFPMSAVRERMRWAGLSEADVDHVTSYERSSACKPHGRYFLETAAELGVAPDRCLMVGDDSVLDMPAAQVGMKTYYVGGEPLPDSDWRGSLGELAALLPTIVD